MTTDQIESSSPAPTPSETPVVYPGVFPTDLVRPQRVLSIQAHPDDQEFTVAGTLARWAREGSQVFSIIVTSGDSGDNDPTHTAAYKPILAEIREKEQLAANAIIGVAETVFLRYPDGMLQATIDLRRDLTRLIRQFKPDAVLTGDPTSRFFGKNYMNHPDHRAAADAACDAVFPSACTRLIFPELLSDGYEPHNVKYVFMHGAEHQDAWIDISATIDIKVQALRQHRTQIGDWDVDAEMRKWAADSGKEHGLPYAESFRLMVIA